ncbi:gamma-glutamyltransferase [Aureispira]|nr:gamma-glutamyltransferase [Aureispira sp.]
MSHGIIAAGHEKTAQAAALILKEGGNAFDAAIAAFLASFISEPCMSSAGGGAFANILTADGKSVFLDFFCQTPKIKRPASEMEFEPMVVNFGETTETFYIGMGAVAVPGVIAGIYHIHKHFATIPMHILVEPALDYARNGVIINDFQFFDICVLHDIMTKEVEAKNIFYPEGKPLAVGKNLQMPILADYLEFLVKEGEREFYEGEFAKQLVKDSSTRGGGLTMDDMLHYKVNSNKPLSFPYRNKKILTNPLPSIGGTLIGLMMRKLEKRYHNNYLPFSNEHVQTLQNIIDEVYRIEKSVPNLNKKWGSTSHFNIVDNKGNAINITMSNGEGCGYMVPGTNVMMNNMLGEASLLPNGYHSWVPDTRLSSMMSPTLVVNSEGKFEIATGTGGGSRIPSVIVQVLHYMIDFGMDVRTAVHSARLHNEHSELNLEPAFVQKHLAVNQLKVINWESPAMFFGGVHTIHKKGNDLFASGDDRRDGFSMIV